MNTPKWDMLATGVAVYFATRLQSLTKQKVYHSWQNYLYPG